MDPVTGSVIVGGAQLLGTGVNAYAQGKMNRKTRKWNEQMYYKQVADNRANWNATNAYNHPLQQMERLRQAGLNPHLVYGKGADTTAGAIQSANKPDWNPQAPKFDLGAMAQNAITTYQNIKMQKLQMDNIAQGIATAKAEESLKKITALKVASETDRTNYDLAFNKEMKDIIVAEMVLKNQGTQANIDKTRQDIDATAQNMAVQLKDLELRQMKNSSDMAATFQSIAESKVRVLRMQLENAILPLQKDKINKEIQLLNMNILNADIDRKIKNVELDLRNQGVQPGDWIWFRKLWQGVVGWTGNDSDWTKNYKRQTYGGRPGFDADGNRQSLYHQMTNPNYYQQR